MPFDDRDPWLSRRAYLRAAGLGAAVGTAGCESLRAGDGSPTPPALDGGHESDTYWSGPERDRPADAPAGTRYFATDTGRQFVATPDGWRAQGFTGPHVNAAAIRGVADAVVTTTAELQAAMANLSAGDTVYVAAGEYRTDRWLTVDRSDVTVVGQSRRNTLVRPADGANVGGFHVGRDTHVENVTIRGLGFHGNARAMDPSVKRLHGFVVGDARNVTVRDCFATRTSPYHEHDAGGSGFTVRSPAEDVAIVGNYTDDIGDRSIQVAGSYVLVRGNRLTNGFDRSISLEVREPDGAKRYSRNVTVVNNVGRDNSDGSVVGASQGVPERDGAGNYAVVGNVAYGRHRRLVYMGIAEAARNVAIVGNVGRQADFHERRSGIYVSGNCSDVTVVGNSLRGYTLDGIEIDSGGSNFVVADNAVGDPARDGVRVDATGASVGGNVVHGAPGIGINASRGAAAVIGNTVHGTGSHGIALRGRSPSLVSGNTVRDSGRRDGDAAGIHVGASRSLVATNLVAGGTGRAAVVEAGSAGANLYVGNRLTGDDAWAADGGSRFVANVPAGRRTEDSTAIEGAETHLAFDEPYPERPSVEVVPETPARWGVEWDRTDGGAFAGMRLRLDAADDEATPRARVRVRPAARRF